MNITIVARYVQESLAGQMLDAITCEVDMIHYTVTLCHPAAGVFDPGLRALHFLEFAGTKFSLEVDPGWQVLKFADGQYKAFKARLIEVLAQEKTDITLKGVQEFHWTSMAPNGPYGDDKMSLTANCFIQLDTGEIVERAYQGLPAKYIERMNVRVGYREIALKKSQETGLYKVQDLEDFQADVRSALPHWTRPCEES